MSPSLPSSILELGSALVSWAGCVLRHQDRVQHQTPFAKPPGSGSGRKPEDARMRRAVWRRRLPRMRCTSPPNTPEPTSFRRCTRERPHRQGLPLRHQRRLGRGRWTDDEVEQPTQLHCSLLFQTSEASQRFAPPIPPFSLNPFQNHVSRLREEADEELRQPCGEAGRMALGFHSLAAPSRRSPSATASC